MIPTAGIASDEAVADADRVGPDLINGIRHGAWGWMLVWPDKAVRHTGENFKIFMQDPLAQCRDYVGRVSGTTIVCKENVAEERKKLRKTGHQFSILCVQRFG